MRQGKERGRCLIMTKPTFEDALAFIQGKLGINLMQYQIEFLRAIYENRDYYYAPVHQFGKRITMESIKLLNEFLTKENVK